MTVPDDVPLRSDGANDWRSYWHEFIRTQWDDFSEQGRGEGLSRAVQEYHDEVTLDVGEIVRWDAQAEQALLNNPSDRIDELEEAFRTYPQLPDEADFAPSVALSGLDSFVDHHILSVGDYRVEDIDNLRVIEGQVSKVAQSKGRYDMIAYECLRCGTVNNIPQPPDRRQDPHECQGCERQGPFDVLGEQSDESDYQLVRVQRPPEQAAAGADADDIDVTLTNELTGSVRPGDRVRLATELERHEDQDEPTYDITGTAYGVDHEDTDFTDLDYSEYEDEIEELANADNTFARIVDSIKPSHRGHHDIKKAIALQLFGGVTKELQDGDTIRGRPHVLLVGDPGLDKTGLLQYATDLVPRSVFTSGKSATAAGLTAAAVNSDFGGGGWTLEPGALVEADQGLCAIDEMDKMDEEDVEGVNEALSNGTVSPAKAGMNNITLPARSTVLAAANPVYGRFDQYEPIGEQIDMDPTLMSRFDLIFTMTDEIDVDEDAALAGHMLDVAQEGEQLEANNPVGNDATETTPDIDADTLRAYVAYAREHCTPVMSDAAKARFKEFYTDVRAKGTDDDSPVPTTPRKIHALVRLGEALARAQMNDTVTEADAELVIDIVLRSLQDVGIDPETGEFDADMVETGESKSQRDRKSELLDVVRELQGEEGAPIDDILAEMKDRGFSQDAVSSELTSLKQQRKGGVFEVKKGFYMLE